MPRFVVLTHTYPEWHWDFMLEQAGVLRTWRLLASPDEQRSAAELLPDHRLAYLDYEGPVSGNRGEVRRWDRGEYALVDESETRLEIRLKGAILNGTVFLEQQADVSETTPPAWLYRFTPEPIDADFAP